MESIIDKVNDRTNIFTDTTQGILTGITLDVVQFRVYNPNVLFTDPLKDFPASRLTIRNGEQIIEAVFPRNFSKLEEAALLGSTVRYFKTRRVSDVYESPTDGIDNHEIHHYELEVLEGFSQGQTITADIQSGDRDFRIGS